MRDKKQHAEYTKQWRINNAQRVKDYEIANKDRRKLNSMKSILKNKYGITIEIYEKMYSTQNVCCAICGEHREMHTSNLAVDHNHDTNEIRGLLCKRCNLLLGSVKDDVQILKNAITYLIKNRKAG